MATTGERLRYALAELAPELGYNELDWLIGQGETGGYVSRIASDQKVRPDARVLLKICQVLGIDIVWLLDGTGSMRREWGASAIDWRPLIERRRKETEAKLKARPRKGSTRRTITFPGGQEVEREPDAPDVDAALEKADVALAAGRSTGADVAHVLGKLKSAHRPEKAPSRGDSTPEEPPPAAPKGRKKK